MYLISRILFVSFIACLLSRASLPIQPIQMAQAQSAKQSAKLRPELVMQTGHTNSVATMSFSPDERILASGSWDNTIKLWDIRTGVMLKTLDNAENDQSNVASVVFSPDGKLIAGGGMDKTVKIWDVQTGALLKILRGHSDWVTSLAFSPDSKRLASVSKDDTIRLWNSNTGALLKTIAHKSRQYGITAVAFAPDGKTLASAGADGTLKLWNASTGAFLKALNTKADALTFAPDGKTLVVSNGYNIVTSWDWNKATVIKTLKTKDKMLECMAFSVDGKTVAHGDTEENIELWDTRSGTLKKKMIPATYVDMQTAKVNWVGSMAFSRSGRLLATGKSDEGTIMLWDTQSGALLKSFNGFQDWVTSVAFAADGNTLVSGNYRNIKLWDAHSGALLKTIGSQSAEHANRIDTALLSPENQQLVSGSEQNVTLWNKQAGVPTKTLSGAGPLAFSPNGKTIVSSGYGEDNETPLKIWDAKTGDLLQTLSNKQHFVWTIAYSPDGKMLSSGGMDGSIKLWNVQTGTSFKSWVGHEDVRTLAFSADSATLASGGRDNTVKLWNTRTAALQQTLTGHKALVQSVAFSADGQLLASASIDGTIKLWDASTGALRQTLVGHKNWVWSVAFSPDSKIVVSGSMDDTIKLWDARQGSLLATITKLPSIAQEIIGNAKTLSLGAKALSLGAKSGETAEGEWFIMTPQGWFDCSANASRFIRWRTGPKIFNLYPAERYYRRLRRPDMVQKALRGELVPEADLSNLDVPPQAQFTRVQYEGDAGDKAAETVTATLEVRGRGGFKEVTVLVNGRPLPPENEVPLEISDAPANLEARPLSLGARPLSLGSRPLSLGSKPLDRAVESEVAETEAPYNTAKRYTFKVPLPVGAKEITLRAMAYDNEDLGSNPTEVVLRRPDAKRVPGNLYILCAGISLYKNGGAPASNGATANSATVNSFSNLKFSAQDAQSLAERLKKEGAPLYEKVEIFNGGPLTNEQATLANLRAGLKWLQSKARPGQIDTVMIFLSGHGLSDAEGHYYFPTHEFDRANWQNTSLSGQELQQELGGKLRARSVFLFVDTCHSGALAGARSDDLNFEINNSGVYMLASSGSTQFSYESDQWGHGAFTLALLRALGRRDLAPDGTIRFNVLTYAVPDEIAKLMQEVGQNKNAMSPVVPLDGRKLNEPVVQVNDRSK